MGLDVSQGQFRLRLIGTPTANRSHTVPDVVDDTFAMLVAAQTLQNKIISGTGTTMPAIIAPAVQKTNDGAANITTSGTTEVVIITGKAAGGGITNPPVAGQILIWAVFNGVSPSVANDIFRFRIRFGATSVLSATEIVTATATFATTTERKVVTLVGCAAIAASGTQFLGITVVRDTGTGTLTLENGRSALQWMIIPGAGTTA